ncbi:MAG: peptidoglycan-binding protein [Treponema sp.]|jgi:hypothetical protein|nr:peptidoglycan-binding protein [Treponema sp.]
MNCHDLLDRVYDYVGEPLPFPLQLQVKLHCFFCPQCAQEIERFELAQDILRNDFFPAGPDLTGAVMAKLGGENFPESAGIAEGIWEEDGGVSFRGWVIAGLILFLSLTSAFLGMDFISIAAAEGSSYLIPLGITMGAIITCYGAIFIGSHLKELSQRFGLH